MSPFDKPIEKDQVPENIRKRMEKLFTKLDEAYPDKVIVGLHKNHKNWGETVTELYRLLGYPDGNTFLTAYGYTVEVSDNKGGRPKNDYVAAIGELKKRYAKGPVCSTVEELKAANPDLSGQFHTLQNQAGALFGMTFSKYLVQEGILIKKEKTDTPKTPRQTPAQSLEAVTRELKNRYPREKPFIGSLSQLARANSDLPVDQIKTWATRVHGMSARAYLIQEGILEADLPPEEKLASITEILKERYADGKQKAYTVADLREQNPDLPIGSIATWLKAVSGQSALDYLRTQKILCLFDWQEAKRIEAERREAESRRLEQKIQEELAQPVKPTFYEPPVYYVEEIDISGEELKNWKYKDDYFDHEGEIYLQDYTGDRNHIIIPTSINGKKIAGLDSFGLKFCKASTVEIPGSIRHVAGNLAFQNNHIRTVIIGEGVETIERSSFSFLPNLTTVKVSASVTQVGEGAFRYTPWYEAQEKLVILGSTLVQCKGEMLILNVPEGIRTIGELVALGSNNLRKVILPRSVTRLQDHAFAGRGTEQIREIRFTPALKQIGSHAFGNNPWTASFGDGPIVINGQLCKYASPEANLVIPEGITGICPEVFKDNQTIRQVVFPRSLRTIGAQAFAGCENLVSAELPESLVVLGAAAFYRCRKLTRMELPDALEEIGKDAFHNCGSLIHVGIGRHTRRIGSSAFEECGRLKTVEMGTSVESIGTNAFYNCPNLESIQLPPGLQELGCGAFNRCTALKAIQIPAGITRIQRDTFRGCRSLERLRLHDNIGSVGNAAFQDCSGLREIVLPGQVGKQALESCTALEKVTLKKGMQQIPERCFYGCTALHDIQIPDTVTQLEGSAFFGCTELEQINIPEGVFKIGDNAFRNCTALERITMPADIPNMGMDAFTNTPYLKNTYVDFVVMGTVLTKYIGSDTHVEIPEGVTAIGDNAFSEAPYVESIVIPDSVSIIGKQVMGIHHTWGDGPACKLKTLLIGNGVTTIEEKAFENCQALTRVVFGKALTTIGKEAFSQCENLTDIDLSATAVTTVGNSAFSGCHRVKELRLPPNIQVIERAAFADISIHTVALPKTVKKVERGAFSGVSELIVYDSIDPDAAEAATWEYNRWNGRVNSPLGCAMLNVPTGFLECQGNTHWRDYHITVLSCETGHVRYRIFCDSQERDAYRVILFSGWGRLGSFHFQAYDDYFVRTRNLLGRFEMAMCRILYPEGLSAEHRAIYEAYLERCMYIRRSAVRNAQWIAQGDRVEYLKVLARYNAIDSHNLGWIRENLKKYNAENCIRYLDDTFSG